MLTHTTRGTMAHEQLDLLAAEGADLARVALSHMDQKLDFGLLRELCERGAYVLFDGPSKRKYATDEERVRLWPRFVEFYPGYDLFERISHRRRIPIVILEPR